MREDARHRSPALGDLPERTLLLSVDFEDWHQLVRRRVGMADWAQPGPALARETGAMLALFEELRVRCTFFILGMAARAHPDLVGAIAAAGHEIACHGDAHLPVHSQTPAEFLADLRRARDTIEELTGQRPIGYRAPAFSITRTSLWAHAALAEEGFAYDASQCDSFARRDRPDPVHTRPHQLPDTGLWEFPVAAWRTRGRPLPVGGASYWTLAPTSLILHGLDRAGQCAGLYLHPNELDPRPLRPGLGPGASVAQRGHGALRGMQRNAARRRAVPVLRAIATHHRLIPYGDAHARLSTGSPART
ncbi:MAG TPA: polysaccharide deacetylase family protein [Solirubrobacteraceae bacterium]|nr:polysaccharide deacetylase family protein [Solirubrobacteraceae bacterium]